MKIGSVATDGKVTITDPSRQGGIVTIYYLGTLFGGIVGGWISDRIGRTRAVLVGTAWGILGASLSASAQNIAWMCCGRVINGIGTG
jgi:MFS family permease